MIHTVIFITLLVSLFTAVGLFFNVTRMRPAREQVVFLMMMFFIIIYLLAMYMEFTMSDHLSTAYLALKFEYLGLCGYLITLGRFMYLYLHMRMLKKIQIPQAIVCAIVLAGAMTMERHSWFYRRAEIVMKNGYHRIAVQGGWIWALFYLWFTFTYLTILVGCYWLNRTENGLFRKRVLYVTVGILAVGIGLPLTALGMFREYNPSSVAFVIQIICMYLAFVRYGYFSELETSRDAFVSAMSHEMRLPLTSLIGMNELILMEDVTPTVQTYAERGKQAGEMLLGLVDDIIDYSQLESGAFSVEKSILDVQEMLHTLYDMEKPQAEKKNLKFVFRIMNPIPEKLEGDKKRMEQILGNLLHNAVKFTPEGRVMLTAEYDEEWFTATVEDTGVGIRRENLETIFLPFERVDSMVNAHIEGTGLGLTISKNLAERMGGTLSVTSEYGVGSRFTLSVPMRAFSNRNFREFIPENRSRERYSRKIKMAESGSIALVIDDNEMNRFLIQKFLQKMGIHSDCAENMHQALGFTEKNRYDIVLIDFKLPGGNGGMLLKEIRRQQNGKNMGTPAILLTALTEGAAKRLRREYGFEDHLTKPLKLKELEDCVFHYIKGMEPHTEQDPGTEVKGTDSLEILAQGGILVDKGLVYSADDRELYESLLELFVSEGNRAKEWKKLFEKKQYEILEIQIHALKNNAFSLGMDYLGQKAKLVEGMLKSISENSLHVQEYDITGLTDLLESYEATYELVERWRESREQESDQEQEITIP